MEHAESTKYDWVVRRKQKTNIIIMRTENEWIFFCNWCTSPVYVCCVLTYTFIKNQTRWREIHTHRKMGKISRPRDKMFHTLWKRDDEKESMHKHSNTYIIFIADDIFDLKHFASVNPERGKSKTKKKRLSAFPILKIEFWHTGKCR